MTPRLLQGKPAFYLGKPGAKLSYMEESPMDQPVNENQQVDLARLKAWVKEGKELLPQLDELLDLVSETGFLVDVQRIRENMIVEDMASQAGLLQKPGETSSGEEVQD